MTRGRDEIAWISTSGDFGALLRWVGLFLGNADVATFAGEGVLAPSIRRPFGECGVLSANDSVRLTEHTSRLPLHASTD